MAVANDPRTQVMQTIANANTPNDLELLATEIYTKYQNDSPLMLAFIRKQTSVMNDVQIRYETARNAISTMVAPDGKSLTDLELETRVIGQIPPNTYSQVKVSTVASYQFVNSSKKARKIELIRANWGLFNIPLFFESTAAFFSALIKKESVYREVISSNMLMQGILASSIVEDDQQTKDNFNEQLAAAYWHGKSIEIIVPFDFSENGVINIAEESKLLSFNINSGKWLRSLFTKT